MKQAGFGVYVHWPFCQSKCPYCDFNSHVPRREVDEVRFARALTREVDHWAGLMPERTVTSVFFGGGTPSLMRPETVATVLDRISRNWRLDVDVEVTLEANPSSTDAQRFAGYRTAGVGRLSLGVQALNDEALRALGRAHSATEALAAAEIGRKAFPRLSVDMIYARPGQSLSEWQQELIRVLSLGTDHLSLYQLTIEAGTRFHTLHRQGALVLPDECLAADMYELTQDMTCAAGLPAYEISNHARAEAQSRHNLTYWRYGEYAGIGPGAHGRFKGETVTATVTHSAPNVWLEHVEAHGHGLKATEPVSTIARRTEFLMMGLRLEEGVALERFTLEAGGPLDSVLDRRVLDRLVQAGLVALDRTSLKATAAGRQRLNALLQTLLPD